MLITHDTFDIARRIKEIDPGYYIEYRNRRFEVRHAGRGGELCLIVPYPELDCRTLELARKTRVERAEAIFAEIEENNRKRGGELL